MDKSIPQQIIEQLGIIQGDYKTPILTDAQINSLLEKIKTKCSGYRGPAKSFMGLFVSAHGDDLDVATRFTIIDGLELEFDFPKINADGDDETITKITKKRGKSKTETKTVVEVDNYIHILTNFTDEIKKKRVEKDYEKKFKQYIEQSVYLQIAMGQPGPSAPMSTEADDDLKPTDAKRGIWDYLSSSAADLAIVSNTFALLNDTTLPPSAASAAAAAPSYPNPCELEEVVKICRHMLRANFVELWDNTGKLSGDALWTKHYLDLIKKTKRDIDKPQIWIQKKLTKYSYDRRYQLAPNKGEDPAYNAFEGLHIVDFRDENGEEVLEGSLGQPGLVSFLPISKTPIPVIYSNKGDPLNKIDDVQLTALKSNLHINNLKFKTFRDRFYNYIRRVKFPIGAAAVAARLSQEQIEENFNKVRAIRSILYAIENEELYLSQICVLAFLLEIDLCEIFDPACRPLSHTVFDKDGKEIITSLRSGTVRDNNIYDALDTFDTQLTQ